MNKIKICLVNRNFPPKDGATGFHAKHLIAFLSKDKNHECEVVTIGDTKENLSRVHFVNGVYSGKSKLKRLVASIIESYRLVKRAQKTKANVYIIMTDPPFLNFMASWFLSKERRFYWTMDLYPEAFVANGLLSEKNVFIKLYKRILKKYPPEGHIALGEKQSAYLEVAYGRPSVATFPIGITGEKPTSIQRERRMPVWRETEHLVFGYIGTVGEAHDEKLIQQVVLNLSKKGNNIVLSLKGSKAERLKSSLSEVDRVFFIEFMPSRHFRFIDVQIVSLLPAWLNVSVPSKAISAVEFGNALLYLGSKEGDTWSMLKEVSWNIDREANIDQTIDAITSDTLNSKKRNLEPLLQELIFKRKVGYQNIIEKLDNFNK